MMRVVPLRDWLTLSAQHLPQFRNDLEQVPRRTKVGDFQGGASSSLLKGTMMTASLMPIICRIALAVPVAAQEFGAVILL